LNLCTWLLIGPQPTLVNELPMSGALQKYGVGFWSAWLAFRKLPGAGG
jgi:hypothetical protein